MQAFAPIPAWVRTVLEQYFNDVYKIGSVAQFVGDFDWILDLVKFFG
jgi:hypothetical protein